jgi:hypothetical protein
MTRYRLWAGVIPGILLGTGTAYAQTAADQAAARALFDEGRALAKAGQYVQACPKFEAAAKLYPGAGTLLNLGDCYEKTGRFASAWAEFGASVAAADRAGRRDQADEARQRQAAIEPKVTKLTVVVPSPVSGITVTRDGTDVSQAAWGTPTPMDAGPHVVRVEASGYRPWTTTVTLTSPGQTISVEIPALVADPASDGTHASVAADDGTQAHAPADGEATAARSPRSRVPAFWMIGAGAAVAVGGGVLMGVESLRAASARQSNTPATHGTSVDEYDSTKTPYYLGLGLAIAGGAAVAAGAVWIATTHPAASSPAALRVTPWASTAAGGCAVGGDW